MVEKQGSSGRNGRPQRYLKTGRTEEPLDRLVEFLFAAEEQQFYEKLGSCSGSALAACASPHGDATVQRNVAARD